MRRWWPFGKLGTGPNDGGTGEPFDDVEVLLRAARPDPAPLTPAASARIFRAALEESGSATKPARSGRWLALAPAPAALAAVVAGSLYLFGGGPVDQVTPPPAPLPGLKDARNTPQPPIGGDTITKPGQTVTAVRATTLKPPKTVRRASGRKIRSRTRPYLVVKRDNRPARVVSTAEGLAPEENGTLSPAPVPTAQIAQLFLMVTSDTAPLRVKVSDAPPEEAGYARVATYSEKEDGGGILSECTVTEQGKETNAQLCWQDIGAEDEPATLVVEKSPVNEGDGGEETVE